MTSRILLLISIFLISINSVSAHTLFSSPENSLSTIEEYIESLNQSLYISVYEFTSPEIMNIINKKNLDVIILVEDNPVGGLKDISKKIFCNLSENYRVYMYKGDLRFLHAKYMIGDNSSILVSSENFGNSKNRGWGAIIDNMDEELLGIFFKDLKDSDPFVCNLEEYSLEINSKFIQNNLYRGSQKRGLCSAQAGRSGLHCGIGPLEAELIIAPDNAEEKILKLIQSANESIYLEQFYIRNWEDKNPFLERILDKAREGLEVKILLDSSWYNLDENKEIVDYINSISAENLEAKLVDFNGKDFTKLHNKGMIIDKKIALVSSINWNENSVKNNREIGLILKGDVSYFVDLFQKDFDSEEISYLYLAITILFVFGFLYIFKNKI